jgi:hypothetical protein
MIDKALYALKNGWIVKSGNVVIVQQMIGIVQLSVLYVKEMKTEKKTRKVCLKNIKVIKWMILTNI